MECFTNGNADNTTEAVHGLDIFTKNWCMNCGETSKQKDLVFRCDECEFNESDMCLVHIFAINHNHHYPLKNFGSMGSL